MKIKYPEKLTTFQDIVNEIYTDLQLTIYIYIYIYVKVKRSLYRLGVTQRVGRGIALLFHDRGTGSG